AEWFCRDGFRSEVAVGVLRVVAAAARALLDFGDGGLAQLSHRRSHQAPERVLALLQEGSGAGKALAPLGTAAAPPPGGGGGGFLQLLLDDGVGVGWERLQGLPG